MTDNIIHSPNTPGGWDAHDNDSKAKIAKEIIQVIWLWNVSHNDAIDIIHHMKSQIRQTPWPEKSRPDGVGTVAEFEKVQGKQS